MSDPTNTPLNPLNAPTSPARSSPTHEAAQPATSPLQAAVSPKRVTFNDILREGFPFDEAADYFAKNQRSPRTFSDLQHEEHARLLGPALCDAIDKRLPFDEQLRICRETPIKPKRSNTARLMRFWVFLCGAVFVAALFAEVMR